MNKLAKCSRVWLMCTKQIKKNICVLMATIFKLLDCLDVLDFITF